MEIVVHAHRAVISEHMRRRTEQCVRKLAARLTRAVDARVLFEQDGPSRRVEITLHAPRTRPLVAEGFGRSYGPALSEAASRLAAQLGHAKRTPRTRARLAGRRTSSAE